MPPRTLCVKLLSARPARRRMCLAHVFPGMFTAAMYVFGLPRQMPGLCAAGRKRGAHPRSAHCLPEKAAWAFCPCRSRTSRNFQPPAEQAGAPPEAGLRVRSGIHGLSGGARAAARRLAGRRIRFRLPAGQGRQTATTRPSERLRMNMRAARGRWRHGRRARKPVGWICERFPTLPGRMAGPSLAAVAGVDAGPVPCRLTFRSGCPR